MKNRQFATALLLGGGLTLLLSACATKNFVREYVGTSETKLSQRADSTDTRLRETADRTTSNTQALEATGQRLQTLDGRIGEVNTLASDAKKDAAQVASAQRDSEAAFNQKFANRNKYAMVEAKQVFFDFNKSVLKDEGINELEDVAKALKADPNAVLELQGFADPRGTEQYNYVLTRDRVDSVVRYLVQRHSIDLRRISAVGMGKIGLAPGEKADKDTYAKARKVEIRLLAPQS